MSNANDNGSPTWQEQRRSQSYGEAGEVEPVATGFDPGEVTIDEVKAYVDKNPDQLEQVTHAETSGKNRATLVDWLEAQSG